MFSVVYTRDKYKTRRFFNKSCYRQQDNDYCFIGKEETKKCPNFVSSEIEIVSILKTAVF
ncbi:WSSV035 [White spot syndrome virus]|uniref:WSSV035 n=1 Tax=White spot syndrome virus TaxID=342409 RepID=A0A2I6SBI0_9VIRU|nr:WSSV035 [White spot syndrome virus]